METHVVHYNYVSKLIYANLADPRILIKEVI